jgi:hypothetical protein
MKVLTMSLASLFCFVPFAANCQFSGFGLSGGGSFSNVEHTTQVTNSNINEFNPNTRTGGTGGIRFDFNIDYDGITKFSPEIFIVQNGSKEFYRDFRVLNNDLINRKISLDYLGIYLPLTLYLPINDSNDAYNGIFMQGKLFGDYAVNGTTNDSFLGQEKIAFNNGFDRVDVGYSFEAGFISNGLTFLIGYNKGVKNIEFANSIGAENQTFQINNKGLTIAIGFIQKISE